MTVHIKNKDFLSLCNKGAQKGTFIIEGKWQLKPTCGACILLHLNNPSNTCVLDKEYYIVDSAYRT